MLLTVLWLVLFASLVLWLAYQRASLAQGDARPRRCCSSTTRVFGAGPVWWKVALWALYLPHVLLNIRPLRRVLISNRFLLVFKRMLPPMSTTEREALEAGTVWWDGELFTGGPDWNKLLSAKAPALSAEEQAFIDGPCEELCRMIDDFDITHRRADLPPEVWDYIKKKGFWAMIIPKKYGGLEFSAYAHSTVVVKIASRSSTVASTVVVPNSLGPAELLLHYGTEEQKQPLPAAARARRGDPLLRAHRPARRLGRERDPGHRRRLPRHVPGPRDDRHPPQLLQALHHARADRDAHRPRLPPVRSRQAAWAATRPIMESRSRWCRAIRPASRSAAATSR